MYCGATAEWTVGSCEKISKVLGGTVFSSVEEKDRVHLTRTSDTSSMIEGDCDDERKTRVHFILGSRKSLMSTMPRECWNCRVYHWIGRTELIQARYCPSFKKELHQKEF